MVGRSYCYDSKALCTARSELLCNPKDDVSRRVRNLYKTIINTLIPNNHTYERNSMAIVSQALNELLCVGRRFKIH